MLGIISYMKNIYICYFWTNQKQINYRKIIEEQNIYLRRFENKFFWQCLIINSKKIRVFVSHLMISRQISVSNMLGDVWLNKFNYRVNVKFHSRIENISCSIYEGCRIIHFFVYIIIDRFELSSHYISYMKAFLAN